MATHIGTLESEVEVVDVPAPGAASEGSAPVDERTRQRLQAERERARIARTLAEGFSD